MIFWGINLSFSLLLFCSMYLFIYPFILSHFEIATHFFLLEKFDQAFNQNIYVHISTLQMYHVFMNFDGSMEPCFKFLAKL